jgi:hypothetical protein
MLTVERGSAAESLEEFLASVAQQRPGGMKLDEFVRAALHHGYRGRQHGELTNRINRTLKKLVHQGVLQQDEEMAIRVVA